MACGYDIVSRSRLERGMAPRTWVTVTERRKRKEGSWLTPPRGTRGGVRVPREDEWGGMSPVIGTTWTYEALVFQSDAV